MENQKIEITDLIKYFENKKWKTRASYDGSKIIYDARRLFGRFDEMVDSRKNKYVNISGWLIGICEKNGENIDLKGCRSLEEFILNYSEFIFNYVIRNLQDNEFSTYWITGIFYYCYLFGKLDILSSINIDYTECFNKEGTLKTNIKKYSYFSKIFSEPTNHPLDLNFANEEIDNALEIIVSLRNDVQSQNEKSEAIIERLEKDKRVRKLRNIFLRDLQLETIFRYGKYVSWNNAFQFPDAAHIISVKKCVEMGKYELISDKNNGVVIDPNTHRLFDRGLISLEPDGKFSEGGKVREVLDGTFINENRAKNIIKLKSACK